MATPPTAPLRDPTPRQWQIAATFLGLATIADERRRWIEAAKACRCPRPSRTWSETSKSAGVQLALEALTERERAIAEDREYRGALAIPDYVGGMPARRPAVLVGEVVDETAAVPAVQAVVHAPATILGRIYATREAASKAAQHDAALRADLAIVTLLGMVPEDFAAAAGRTEARKAVAELTPEEIQTRLRGLLG